MESAGEGGEPECDARGHDEEEVELRERRGRQTPSRFFMREVSSILASTVAASCWCFSTLQR